jgi:hypothetical protein
MSEVAEHDIVIDKIDPGIFLQILPIEYIRWIYSIAQLAPRGGTAIA